MKFSRQEYRKVKGKSLSRSLGFIGTSCNQRQVSFQRQELEGKSRWIQNVSYLFGPWLCCLLLCVVLGKALYPLLFSLTGDWPRSVSTTKI